MTDGYGLNEKMKVVAGADKLAMNLFFCQIPNMTNQMYCNERQVAAHFFYVYLVTLIYHLYIISQVLRR